MSLVLSMDFACWEKNALSILQKYNLVSNIGIGPNASNTKSETTIDYFPFPPSKVDFSNLTIQTETQISRFITIKKNKNSNYLESLKISLKVFSTNFNENLRICNSLQPTSIFEQGFRFHPKSKISNYLK